MSFSFQVRRATKGEVKEVVAAEMKTVIETQPLHAGDEEAVNATVSTYLDLLADQREDHDVSVSVAGSLGTVLEGAGATTVSASINIYAAFVLREI